MFKKTLISLAVASSLGLTGCFDSAGSGKNANPDYKINNPAIDGKTWPVFNPLLSQLPIPNDLIFDSEQGDGTFGVADSSPPVTTALNELSGASTVAPAVIQFNGQIDPGTVVYGETVFLLELDYASGDPVQGLSIGEPPTVAGPAPARADVETLDGTSAIRILPLQPLNPRKRYIAVVTKDITDINGEAIIASPSYSNLTDEEQPLGNAALAPVRTLINSLWEPIAGAALGITDEDIAISYSFTTSNDEKVLQYIAEPAAWFADQLLTFVKVSAAEAAIEGGASSFDQVDATVTGAVTAFPSAEIKGALDPGDQCPVTGEDFINCVAPGIAAQFSPLLPTPTPDNRSADDFDLGAPEPVTLVSSVAASVYSSVAEQIAAGGGTPPDVLAVQGTVSLPYYLGTSGSEILANSWQADDSLAGALNEAFSDLGLVIPQSDTSVSTTVNYVFPFPKKTADVDVPALIIYPATGTTNGVVMYQHGITTDRSAALSFGTALATLGYTVVAIDQPLHGVGAFTEEDQDTLATRLLEAGQDAGLPASLAPSETTNAALIAGQLNLNFVMQALSQDEATAQATIDDVLTGGTSGDAGVDMAIGFLAGAENSVANAGSTLPGLAPMEGNERHFGFYSPTPGTVDAIDYAAGEGDSGSMFINLLNFTNSRDNIRQSAVDQMNLRVSLSDLDLSGIGGADLSTAQFNFAGHSLGTITGAPFVASVNENQLPAILAGDPAAPVPSTYNDIAAVNMLTPGGGVVRLLENSRTFAPQILAGLGQSGLSQGDANLESFLNVFQATIDTADPINFVDNLAGSTPTYLMSEVEADTVIPNAADEAIWGIPALSATIPASETGLQVSVTVDSFNAPLAGSRPLSLMYADGIADALYATYTQADFPAGEGEDPLNHGTPVSASPAAAFSQMVQEAAATFTP
ncbi:hypothetical protein [Marinobacter sp. HN1S83]|uniref:hypothetical protein n=1 Tax=Marinobacter sp. HN1S83 TaxID=3382301 RepID=UPI00387AD87B